MDETLLFDPLHTDPLDINYSEFFVEAITKHFLAQEVFLVSLLCILKVRMYGYDILSSTCIMHVERFNSN